MYGSKFTKYLHGTWSLLNILMIFDIKDKSIILTHTMFFFFAIATNISQRLKTGFESESKSDVTYGQVWWSILWIHALHLTHPKCTHTPWTHTRSSGQPFMLRRPGSCWGFGALLKGTSVVVLRVEKALNIHCPTYNSYRPETRTRNLSITSPTL